MFSHALSAIQAGAFCHPFDDHIHLTVRATLRIAEDKIVRPCLYGYGAALAVTLLAITLVTTGVLFRLRRRG